MSYFRDKYNSIKHQIEMKTWQIKITEVERMTLAIETGNVVMKLLTDALDSATDTINEQKEKIKRQGKALAIHRKQALEMEDEILKLTSKLEKRNE